MLEIENENLSRWPKTCRDSFKTLRPGQKGLSDSKPKNLLSNFSAVKQVTALLRKNRLAQAKRSNSSRLNNLL
jgi:hypothetical protein